MPIETEHKYLIKKSLWANVIPERSVEMKQAYLLKDADKTIRIRVAGNKGFITIKGRSNGSASRLEYEYEIPLIEAEELISSFTSELIEKIRHYVTHDKKLWEVDEFRAANQGLFVAEIELNDEHEQYSLPAWVDQDVTSDRRYANSNLCVNPFTSW